MPPSADAVLPSNPPLPLGVPRSGLGCAVVRDRIYLAGGHNGQSPMRNMDVFEPSLPGKDREEEFEWRGVGAMLGRRAYLACAELGERVYAIGGSADGRALNTVEVFYPDAGDQWAFWFTMPPMQTKRAMAAAANGAGKIYVVGGFDGTRDLATVECYDKATNSWKWRSSMATSRSYLSLVAANRGQSLFAIGGQNRLQDAGPRAHHDVEQFDLWSELWSPAPPLLVGRLGCASGVLQDAEGGEHLYVCGGSDGTEVLASVEVFNLQDRCWREAPAMSVARLGHVAAVVHNRLFVLGGFDGRSPLNTYECFDPELGCWGPPTKMGADD